VLTDPLSAQREECEAEEPIHLCGRIQPHGVLLALDALTLHPTHVSDNLKAHTGLDPQALFAAGLEALLAPSARVALARGEMADGQVCTVAGHPYCAAVHRGARRVLLELEPLEDPDAGRSAYEGLDGAIARLQAAESLAALCRVAAAEVRRLTGFERVKVYRFDDQWNGTVVAEERAAHMASYLGLSFPAGDIPPLARRLFAERRLRYIPDVARASAALMAAPEAAPAETIDLGPALLRAVSPIHVEYLSNMGVAASLTLAIVRGGELWGLIACHHATPRTLPRAVRSACALLAQVISLELAVRADAENYAYRLAIKSAQGRLVEYMALEEHFSDGLLRYEPNLLDIVAADGAAVCLGERVRTLGETPPTSGILALVEWLAAHHQEEVPFATHALPSLDAGAAEWAAVASGLLAVPISLSQRHYLLWFRRERLRDVHWAGDPGELVWSDAEGLHPRRSFALWQQTVGGTSLSWRSYEIEAVRELREAILGMVLKRSEELARLNSELERSNSELDAFAYIASHDLKEPLRGIHNYARFLIEDYGDRLDAQGVARLETLVRLSRRMEELINSLLHFSRVGRMDLSFERTDLNELVHHVLDLLSMRIEETGATVRVVGPLPTVRCDRVRLGEVFNNLIANALKYNDKPERFVEIGHATDCEKSDGRLVFYVRDNGIGIREKHLESIFRMFKRLHPPEAYGEGAGVGLTIARKIVERHGGEIWVASAWGEGTTVYFSIEDR